MIDERHFCRRGRIAKLATDDSAIALRGGGSTNFQVFPQEITMIRACIVVSALAAAISLLTLTGRGTALAAGPEDSVSSFHETLISTMKDGRTLGESGRYARIQPVIHRL